MEREHPPVVLATQTVNGYTTQITPRLPINTPSPKPLSLTPTISLQTNLSEPVRTPIRATPPLAPITPSPSTPPTPTGTRISTPIPVTINHLSDEAFIWLPLEVLANSQQIYNKGQQIGRNPHRFSILGDSAAVNRHFLALFDGDEYQLAAYEHLQPTIDYFAGSFSRSSMAVRQGLSTAAVLDPFWADKAICLPNENMLQCEIRLYNPSYLLILLGTNDSTGDFEANLSQIVQETIAQGVVPILATKANRVDGYASPRNISVRLIAAEFQIPLWDFDRVADTLPNRGLDEDNIHLLVFPEQNYHLSWSTLSGYGAYNLTALIMLDKLWRNITND